MKRWALPCFAWMMLAPVIAGATEYVNDPLTSDPFSGRGSKGGTFSANGWTTTGESDAVWWEVPDALPTGHVEFTVTGISLTTLTGTDHDIFTMYQAPTGQAEPIAYSPYFRNNDFKTFTRIFGVQEPNRGGAMKLEFAFCPRGEPWYHDTACPAECDGSGLAYANGTDKDVGWDGATPYTIAIDWGNAEMSFSRNGTKLGAVTYPNEWAPKPLRVRLGSPRHDGIYPGLAMMPLGITFKNVIVSGTAGTMTPICGGTVVPDAGPTSDSGSTDSGSSSNEYGVLADVTAASWEPAVYSVVTDLNVEADATGNPTGVVYLRFPSVSGTLQNAVLHLRTAPDSSAAGGSGIVCMVSDDTWQETTMTWSNRPQVSTTCVGSPFSVDPDTEYQWDVTALAQAGKNINLAVVSHDSNGAHYLSKEASATLGPRITIEATSGGGSGGGSGASGGTDGGWSDSGINGGGKGGSGGLKAGGGTNEDDGGCGCRTPASVPASLLPPAFVLIGWLGLTIRRRRRR